MHEQQQNWFDIHFKSEATDGVSLMMTILRETAKEYGITVHTASADVQTEQKPGLRISNLSYQTLEAKRVNRMLFENGQTTEYITPQEIEQLEFEGQQIAEDIKRHILEHSITQVVIRNIFSLPLNIPAMMALKSVIMDPELEAVSFLLVHHDFYWESSRAHNYQPKGALARELLEIYAVPDFSEHPNLSHAVINSVLQAEVEERHGVRPFVLPDSGRFTRAPELVEMSEKRSLREVLSIGEADVMVEMPTRVVPRKAIEFAVLFVKTMEDPHFRAQIEDIGKTHGFGPNKRKFDENSKIYLVIPQGEDLCDSQDYVEALTQLAENNQVHLIFAGEQMQAEGIDFFSVYKEADVVVYPSVSEGFGNQLLEIVEYGHLPILFSYPVFSADISEYLPHHISLGDTFFEDGTEYGNGRLRSLPLHVYDDAVQQLIDSYHDSQRLEVMLNDNFTNMSAQFGAHAVFQGLLKNLVAVK